MQHFLNDDNPILKDDEVEIFVTKLFDQDDIVSDNGREEPNGEFNDKIKDVKLMKKAKNREKYFQRRNDEKRVTFLTSVMKKLSSN